jgi:hypothetical protein
LELFLLYAAMLFVMLMRVFMPLGTKKSGKVTKVVNLSLPERFALQRINLCAIGAVVLMMILFSDMPTGAVILVLLVAQAIMLIPVRCTLTSEGLGLNNVVFRHWSEFTGYASSTKRIVLLGRDGTRPFNLPLLEDNQKQVLPALRRHLPELPTRKEARAGKRASVG